MGRAAAVVGRTGARWLTMHTDGGADMLRAGVEGLAEGSDGEAQVLGVTILTSQIGPIAGVCSKSGWRWPAMRDVAA